LAQRAAAGSRQADQWKQPQGRGVALASRAIIITLCLAFAGYVLVSGADQPERFDLFPKLVVYVLLALMALELGRALWSLLSGRKGADEPGDSAVAASVEGGDDPGTGDPRRLVELAAWITGYTLLTWAVGLLYATPVFLFSFLVLRSGMRLLGAAVSALAAFLVIYAAMSALQLQLPPSWFGF
jgi:hypothetical protein